MALALSQLITTGNALPATVARPGDGESLPAVLDLAYKRRLMRRLDPSRAWQEATDTERELCRQKERFVREIDALRRRGHTRQRACAAVACHLEWFGRLVESGLKLGLANYDQWQRQLEAGSGHPRALLPQYKQGAARRQLGTEWYPEFAEILCRQFFHANGLDMTVAYRNACCRARDLALEIPSESQARRYLERVLGERVQMMLRDPVRYRDELSGYLMLRWNCEPGAVWIGDHRVLDVFVRVPVLAEDGSVREWVAMRPWCTAWMDARSGYVVSLRIYVDRYPNYAKILEALYLGILAAGNVPPAVLVTDNGKDYLKKGALQDVLLQTMNAPTRGRNGRKTLVEETFEDVTAFDGEEYRHSVARALGCQTRRTAPYKGRQKPIERVFRNFARAFDKQWYGYAGNRPGTRPEEIRDFRGNVMRLLTVEELIDRFRDWIGPNYHQAPTKSRRTEGRTPLEVWQSRTPVRTPLSADELQWAMLVPERELYTVRSGPGGSNVWFRGWPYEGVGDADHIALGDHHGRELVAKTSWAPTLPDVPNGAQALPARIWLFTPDGRYLAEAQPAMERDVFGTTREQQERISETCRKVAVLRRADREARDALAGSSRIFAPAHEMGWQRQAGPAPDPDAAAVGGSVAQGAFRGRLVAAGDTAAAPAPEPAPEPDPAAAAAYRRWMECRAGMDGDEDSDGDTGGRETRFAEWEQAQGGQEA